MRLVDSRKKVFFFCSLFLYFPLSYFLFYFLFYCFFSFFKEREEKKKRKKRVDEREEGFSPGLPVRDVNRTLIGGGGVYSYIHVLPDRFHFKLINLNLI